MRNLAAIKKYALDNKYEIVGEYIDAGKSAKTVNRPEFQEMISLSKTKPTPFENNFSLETFAVCQESRRFSHLQKTAQ